MGEVFFDHSALTRIYEAGDQSEAILTGIRSTMGRIRITTLNVLDAAARSDESDRRRKLDFYRELTGVMNPADPPNELLIKTAIAYLEGERKVSIGSTEAWRLLHEPDVLTRDLYGEEMAFTKERTEFFRRMHEELRITYQAHFEKVPSDRATDAVELIKYFCERIDTYLDILFIPLFELATGVNPGREKIRAFVESCDAWRLYCGGESPRPIFTFGAGDAFRAQDESRVA